MKLLRMIVVRFEALVSSDWTEWKLNFGDTPVETFGVAHDGSALHVFLTCQRRLDSRPDANADGHLVPDEVVRRHLEEQLEQAVDAVSIATRSNRSIRSVEPCVAFVPESDDELAWLEQYRGVARGQFARPFGHPRIPYSIVQTRCADRPDGIALLAEAIAHPHPSGRFHEFFRVYERAFKMPCSQLGEPLAKFLEPNRCGYSRNEVNKWIDLRGPLTHADRRPTFFRERDASPVIHRMEQAAFDVIINKKTWRDPSATRDPLWRPAFGSEGPNGAYFAIKGQDAEIRVDVFDQFGTYPLDLKYRLEKTPVGWWTGRRPASRDTGIIDFPGNSVIDVVAESTPFASRDR